MKRYRLKRWVKIVLAILIIMAVVMLIRYFTAWDRQQVINCVENGHSYNWCIQHLH